MCVWRPFDVLQQSKVAFCIWQQHFGNQEQNERNMENNAMVAVDSKQAANADVEGLKVQINSIQ